PRQEGSDNGTNRADVGILQDVVGAVVDHVVSHRHLPSLIGRLARPWGETRTDSSFVPGAVRSLAQARRVDAGQQLLDELTVVEDGNFRDEEPPVALEV